MGNSHGKPILLTDEVTLNHFRLLRVVGKGAFGKVRIVERKDTGLTFALKYIRKDEVVRSESVRNIIRERRMLEHLNHPFLCNLRYSFQDVEYLYIVVDLMTGGDLRFHITRKTFMEEAVRFWIAELGCALRYIHQQGIVHRDVKPDNVLLDAEGHVHLADFNVASDFTPARALNSRSGTLAYLAPEVYAGRGYFSEVDWWSLGVLFYECIYNKRPFDANHPDALAQAVMKANVQYPKTSPPISQPCLHAISSLLERDRTRRIGAVSFDSFTDNPFFREIDFEALERKEVEPIFCPSSEKTNFDATYDLEELLLEEAPLEARARKQKPRAELREDATQQEIRADELHRMVETMFEPFNYTLLPQHRDPAAQGIASVPVPAGLGNSTMISGGMGPSNVTRSRSKVRTHDVDFSGILDRTRSGPPSRTQTATGASLSHNNTNTRSSTHSPNGSPPLSTIGLPPNSNFIFPPLPDGYPPMPPSPLHYQQQAPYQPSAATSSGGNPQQIRSHDRPRNFRSASLGGSGSQVVLEPRPSCNDLSATPQQHRQHPGSDESRRAGPGEKASGVIAFFNRKKGRDRSPKPPKERERGVLGKEGARVIVSPG